MMEFAADFTAIDFETASRQPDSACQLGAVVVRNGHVVDRFMWMIRPEPLYFSQSNIRIHGITPAQVRDEPTFGEIWSDIHAKLGDDCLVAHNASFDIRVLLACLRTHGHPVPEMQFTCTRAIARRTWPHRHRFGLKPLAQWLGIRFQHHDALEDSLACAKILLAAGIDREVSSLDDLEQSLKLSRGRAGSWGLRGPTTNSRKRPVRKNHQSTSPKPAPGLPFLFPNQTSENTEHASSGNQPEYEIDMQRILIRGEFVRPLHGKRIAFVGKLKSMSDSDAEILTTRLGGIWQAKVNEETDYVVIGSSRKMCDFSREEPLEKDGEDDSNAFQIVNEKEFLNLVTSGV